MRESPVIGECVVYCPERTHLVAVVSPATDPADDEAISAHLERANALLAPDEQIRRVVVAREPFSIDNGLLTSQFKPQRKRIFEAYRREIHDLEGKTHAR
jgi:long-subunit acyl-CoA synthetase (AMP-forming)